MDDDIDFDEFKKLFNFDNSVWLSGIKINFIIISILINFSSIYKIF